MSDNTDNKNNGINQPKVVEITPGSSFIANGTTYRVMSSFSIGRLPAVTLMEEELAMFTDRGDCHKVMLEAMNLMNEMKHGDAYAIMYNKIHSDRQNAQTMHFTLRMCTAYINYDGEDIKSLKEEDIRKKINDWSEEGLDVRPFLRFAMSAYNEFFQNYKKDILSILTEARNIKEVLKQETDISSLTESVKPGEEK